MTPLYRHFVSRDLFFGFHPYRPIRWLLFVLLACLLFPALSPALAESLAAATPVSDKVNRRTPLSPQPQRIVALAPSITEILFSLGLSHRVAGVTRFSDYPPEAANLPHVGSYVQLDIEKIVSLKPDLCIAIRDGNPESVINRLESLNIPVYTVNPQNLSSVMETLLELGRLLDAEPQAEKIVSDMRARVETVRNKVAAASKAPGVFLQIGISPIVSVGSHTFINELITLSGGVNLAAGDTHYPRLSREAVIRLRPDILIITSMTRQAVFEAVKREWEEWTVIPAVQNDRIYLVDSNILDRPTPRLVEGLEMLARLIHPECFEPADGKHDGFSQ